MSCFKELKNKYNYKNEIRKVGFELEFSNIDLEDVVEVLEKEFSLKKQKVNNYFYKFDSEYGEYIFELDFELLTKQKIKKSANDLSKTIGLAISQNEITAIEDFLGQLSTDIVPYEISTPPLPLDKLSIVEEIVEKLDKNGAKGTMHKFYYAFGLHINIEVVSLSVESLLSYLRAYVILQDFLIKDAQIDLTRKITPFIDNFNNDYIRYILHSEYKPTIESFIDDYIKFNPTRNRSLDMLPILGFIDEKRVRKLLPYEKIKPRPAFHYRLSNSMIGDKHWKVSTECNRWLQVELLANNKQFLKELSTEYLNYLDNFINLESWEEKVSLWLENH